MPKTLTSAIRSFQISKDDSEHSTEYVLPVTLRAVEAAGVDLDSRFGINDEEHAEFMDAPDMMRVVFGVYLSDECEVSRTARIETFSAHPFGDAKWTSCMATYYSAKGWVDRGNYANNSRRAMAVAESVLTSETVDRLLKVAARPFEQYAAEANAEAEAERLAQEAEEEYMLREMGLLDDEVTE